MKLRIAFVAISFTLAAATADFTLGDAAQQQAPAFKGNLVIVGGGGTPDEVWQRFMQMAGGDTARIVQIQTAAADADSADTTALLRAWYARKPKTARIFHTRDKALANNPDYVKPLREATGVWFVGGVQSRITEAYLGTLVEKELNALLQRGGVIGGTSAGAAIMTDVMITGGNPEATLGKGFGFLPGAIADQHFIARNRQPRLVGALKKNPGLIGYGIDERTALIVERGRPLEVLGSSLVLAIRIKADGEAAVDTMRPRAPGNPARLY